MQRGTGPRTTGTDTPPPAALTVHRMEDDDEPKAPATIAALNAATPKEPVMPNESTHLGKIIAALTKRSPLTALELKRACGFDAKQFQNHTFRAKRGGLIAIDGLGDAKRYRLATDAPSAPDEPAAPKKTRRSKAKPEPAPKRAKARKPQRKVGEGRNASEVQEFILCGPASAVRVLDLAGGGVIVLDGGHLAAELQPHQLKALGDHISAAP